jgi:DNA-binding transcriptional LysR family regulator
MQQIRYFLALADTLNFTRAAEECNVSQPALTRAIQALEAELGGELIRREGRRSHLTELGKRMLPLMQRCYDSAVTARELARAVTTSEVAPLALALSNSVNIELFLGPVAELFKSLPGVQFRIAHGRADEVMRLLKEGEADLAIAGPVEDRWERLDRWPLFGEGFEIALSADHPLSRDRSVEVAELKGQTIFVQSGCESRAMLMEWFDERGAALIACHEVDSHHDLNALLIASGGVALVPESAPRSTGLTRAKVNGLMLMRTVSAYAVAGRRRGPAVSTFLNLLRSSDFTIAA